MTKVRSFFLASLMVSGLVVTRGGLAQEPAGGGYIPPVIDEIPIDIARIDGVDKRFLEAVGGQCMILVRNIVMDDDAKSKMMAVALGIIPEDPAVKSTHALLSAGETPPRIKVQDRDKKQVSSQTVYVNLNDGTQALMAKTTSDDGKMLAAMLLDALSGVSKGGEVGGARDRYQKENGVVPPWDRILDRRAGGATSGTPEADAGLKLKSKQARVNALLVLDLGRGSMAGQASLLNATYLSSGRGASQRRLRFNQTVGEVMEGALPEVANYMEVRHDKWIQKGLIEFAFREKISPKDGDSVGLACGLLVEALVSGLEFDDKLACTGALNVDGSVQPIGGVVAKLRGAQKAGCEFVVIPYANRYALTDLTVLGEAAILAKMQVFVVNEFDEAVALAKSVRAEELAGAIEDFRDLQVDFEKKGVMNVLRTDEAKELLASLLERAPNHASARLMLAAADGRLPRTLSLNGSMEELFSTFAKQSELVTPPPALRPRADKEAKAFELRRKDFERLLPKLEVRTKPIGESMLQFSKACERSRSLLRGDLRAQQRAQAEIAAAFEEMFERIKKIESDPELLEDLMKQ